MRTNARSPVLSGCKYSSENVLRNFSQLQIIERRTRRANYKPAATLQSRGWSFCYEIRTGREKTDDKRIWAHPAGIKHKRSLPAPKLSTVQTLFQNPYRA